MITLLRCQCITAHIVLYICYCSQEAEKCQRPHVHISAAVINEPEHFRRNRHVHFLLLHVISCVDIVVNLLKHSTAAVNRFSYRVL